MSAFPPHGSLIEWTDAMTGARATGILLHDVPQAARAQWLGTADAHMLEIAMKAKDPWLLKRAQACREPGDPPFQNGAMAGSRRDPAPSGWTRIPPESLPGLGNRVSRETHAAAQRFIEAHKGCPVKMRLLEALLRQAACALHKPRPQEESTP